MEWLKKAAAPVSENTIKNVLVLFEFLNVLKVSFKPAIQAEPNDTGLPLSI
jgi:hypothetical protein